MVTPINKIVSNQHQQCRHKRREDYEEMIDEFSNLSTQNSAEQQQTGEDFRTASGRARLSTTTQRQKQRAKAEKIAPFEAVALATANFQ